MEKLPLITVIIPVYNIKEYLERCVQSVANQTYRNLEILLVDDGSGDGTSQICDRLAGEDQRIRVIHKENGGSSSARNVGLAEMKGEYVGFVDSDDYIEPDMYEKLYGSIEEAGALIAQIGRNEIEESGERLPDICIPPKEREVIRSGEFMRELLMHRGDCSFCTKLFRSSVLSGRKFPEGKLNEDFHLLIQILPLVEKLVSLPDYGYHVFYRMGSNSRKESKNEFSRVFEDSVDNADLAARIVKEHYPELEQTALRFGIFQRLEYLLHIPIPQMTAENRKYREIVGYLRKNWKGALKNSLLTRKNKIYMMLFVIAPRGIRVLHKKWKRL